MLPAFRKERGGTQTDLKVLRSRLAQRGVQLPNRATSSDEMSAVTSLLAAEDSLGNRVEGSTSATDSSQANPNSPLFFLIPGTAALVVV
jgi:hypothetical protein